MPDLFGRPDPADAPKADAALASPWDHQPSSLSSDDSQNRRTVPAAAPHLAGWTPEPPLKRFRAGEVGYLRVRVIGATTGFEGEPAAGIEIIQASGEAFRPEHAWFVREDWLIKASDAVAAIRGAA